MSKPEMAKSKSLGVSEQELHDSFDSLARTVLRCKAERDALLEACRVLEKTSKEFAGCHSSAHLNAEKYRHHAWKAMLDAIMQAQAAIQLAEKPHD